MATLAILGGETAPRGDEGMAGSRSRVSKRSCSAPMSDRSMMAPWDKSQDAHRAHKKEVAGRPLDGVERKCTRKIVAPKLNDAVNPPWNRSTKAVEGKRATYTKFASEAKNSPMKGARWHPEPTPNERRPTDGVTLKPWERAQSKPEGRVRTDPFSSSPARNKSSKVLLHNENGEEHFHADAGRKIFSQKTMATALGGGSCKAVKEGFVHTFVGEQDTMLRPSTGKSTEKQQHTPGSNPWDKESREAAGKLIHQKVPTYIADDGMMEKNKTGRTTFANHRSHSHEPLWSPPQQRAQTPGPRSPAPWDKGSLPSYSQSPRSTAPWNKTDGSHSRGVSTKARQHLIYQKAWNNAAAPGSGSNSNVQHPEARSQPRTSATVFY
eukprot:TRINITY_DN1309_c1_g1_i1.p1 TRINITY_DN1309_c1_g1~~TRINITY_DN1309_c1_g1_i1.p1  ORF type:complete len:392 (+),score=47.83 TRINITY_DN1309_c1_g1_i1:39-1178(+)